MMANALPSSSSRPLETMERVDFVPDVLHAHDYHTAEAAHEN